MESDSRLLKFCCRLAQPGLSHIYMGYFISDSYAILMDMGKINTGIYRNHYPIPCLLIIQQICCEYIAALCVYDLDI